MREPNRRYLVYRQWSARKPYPLRSMYIGTMRLYDAVDYLPSDVMGRVHLVFAYNRKDSLAVARATILGV